MIQVVNKKHWCGEGVYIGRPSPLGNPFSHLDSSSSRWKTATRAESIERFREWFDRALADSTNVRKAFDALVEFYLRTGHLTLICWCAPSPCHGSVIKERILAEIEAISKVRAARSLVEEGVRRQTGEE